jgi:hypothetical protein
MPAFIPFMLAGIFTMLSAGAVLEATGLSQSNLFTNKKTTKTTTTTTQRSNQTRSTAPAQVASPSITSTKSTPAPEAAVSAPAQTRTPAAVPPKIPQPDPPPTYKGVKAAPIDTVVFIDEPLGEGYFEDALFQNFGGQELLSISRSDTVNGQDVSYQPFKDLGIIRDTYTPNKLLSIQETSDRFFANFLIRLNEKIPNVGYGPNGTNVYLEEGETGSVIIDFINIENNEQVEIQILNAGIIEDIGI